MTSVVIAGCWGLLDKPYLMYTAVLVWGTGDTAAALIGKRYGRHIVRFSLADGKKTWEGSLSMAATAFAAGLCALLLTSPYPLSLCLLQAALTAPAAAFIELISKGGNDTVTVPVGAVLLLTAFSFIL